MKRLIPRAIGASLNTLAAVAPPAAGRLGFRLFCQTLPPRLKPHHRTYLEAARAFAIENRGDHIQGYRWGHGPRRVLLVHGWNSNSYFWRKLIEALPADEFTLVAYDAPGHGLSGSRWLHLPRNAEVWTQVMAEQGPFEGVVGHSFGAFTSLYAVSQRAYPGLERVVVLACPGRVSDFMQYYQSVLGLNERAMRLIDRRCEQKLGYPVGWFNAADFARGLIVRGLIVHDPADLEAPYAHAEHMAAGWPRAQLVTAPGTGHNLRGASVVAAVRNFVATGDVPSGVLAPDAFAIRGKGA